MLKHILLIGNRTSKNTRRLSAEAANVGVTFDVIAPRDFYLDGTSIKLGLTVQLSLPPLAYDLYLFRGLPRDRLAELQTLAAYLSNQGKRVTERSFTIGQLPDDKIVPLSSKETYKVPTTIQISIDTIDCILPTITFPTVVKIPNSSMGRGVKKCDTANELHAFLKDIPDTALVQDYYSIEYDTRVLVVGAKVLGGMRRYKRTDEAFLTTAPGGRREATVLTDAETAAALEATKLRKLEIAGVDLFTFKGHVYVLEVNASPQFQMFEKTTHINVAKEIISYFIKSQAI